MNADTLTVTQAADELGVTRTAVFDALRRGTLHGSKVAAPTRNGFYWTFTRDEIERYRREHRRANYRRRDAEEGDV